MADRVPPLFFGQGFRLGGEGEGPPVLTPSPPPFPPPAHRPIPKARATTPPLAAFNDVINHPLESDDRNRLCHSCSLMNEIAASWLETLNPDVDDILIGAVHIFSFEVSMELSKLESRSTAMGQQEAMMANMTWSHEYKKLKKRVDDVEYIRETGGGSSWRYPFGA